jgi:arachidonate 15-lipoxygenase
MAKYCLQVADANVHETMQHLGSTHMVMEAVGIAAHRQLLPDHPLFRLVQFHLEGTFAVNNSAKTSLIAPGGVIDKVFSARIDVAASLVRKALDNFVLQDCAPAREIRSRGLDDPSAIEYPYRDDVLPVYAAIERFARAYVGLYYADDAAVAGDTFVQAWVDEVGSSIGGALQGIRGVKTVAALVEWMTNILHISSAQHAAVNFPQFPYFGWGTNVAGALWGPPPSGAVTDADLLQLMPPWDCLFLQSDTVYELAGVQYTRLGRYTFPDAKTVPVVQQFQKELASIDQAICEADASRIVTYPFLRPSEIPASINI